MVSRAILCNFAEKWQNITKVVLKGVLYEILSHKIYLKIIVANMFIV